MLYNFVTDSFHTKKPCNRLFQAKYNFRWKTTVFEPRGLKGKYDVHLGLI